MVSAPIAPFVGELIYVKFRMVVCVFIVKEVSYLLPKNTKSIDTRVKIMNMKKVQPDSVKINATSSLSFVCWFFAFQKTMFLYQKM